MGRPGGGWPRLSLDVDGRAGLKYQKPSPLLADALDPRLLSVGTSTVVLLVLEGNFHYVDGVFF